MVRTADGTDFVSDFDSYLSWKYFFENQNMSLMI